MAKDWIEKVENGMKSKGTEGSFGKATKKKVAAGKKKGGKIAKKAVFAGEMKKFADQKKEGKRG